MGISQLPVDGDGVRGQLAGKVPHTPTVSTDDKQRVIRAITKVTIDTIKVVHRAIRANLEQDPETALEQVRIGFRGKIALSLDVFAERLAVAELSRRLRRFKVRVLGEESLRDPQLDFSQESRIVLLLDVLDGTDLIERGLGNWCTAVVVYYPPEREIMAAFVATPEGQVYFWTLNTPEPLRYDSVTGRLEHVSGPSLIQRVSEASVAFYGQKLINFFSGAEGLAGLHTLAATRKDLTLRLYNLAGIPAMVKLVESNGRRRLDCVLELHGQKAHDMVAGAVIAEKAGATLLDLYGNRIDLSAALERPADPDRELRYVLAATPELASEILGYLRVGTAVRSVNEVDANACSA